MAADYVLRDQWDHFIDGRFVPPGSGERLAETDPRSRDQTFLIARGNAADVDRAARAARLAQPAWAARRPVERGRVLSEIARLIRRERDLLTDIEQRETGKPRGLASSEVDTAARYFEYYAGLVDLHQGEVIDLGDAYHAYTRRQPYGVIGVILPWNAPINHAARGIAPALAVGNAVVVKPSEFTSVSLLLLAELATGEGGLPPGLVNVVTGTGAEVGEPLVRHPAVRKVAFTGSVRAGQAIGVVAAERIMPVGLELGGKSPNIVFADADLEKAASGVIKGFTLNAGQLCSAGSRCLVERSIHAAFLGELKSRVSDIAIGPVDDDQIGPIVTERQFAQVQDIYRAAESEEGGEFFQADLPAGLKGRFVPPAIFTTERVDSAIMQQEVFGPLLTVTPFDTEAEAVELANASEYGLAAGVWTQDLGRAHRLAGLIEAGQVYVNEYFAGGVETPFGGMKKSGHGREKGLEALREYTQLKSVSMRLT